MIELRIGGKYTVFSISSCLACTIKQQIVITDKTEERYVFRGKGKRKKFYLTINEKTAIFEGHELPFIADVETSSFSGNACINLIGDDSLIKDWFENKQLNLLFDKSRVLIVEEGIKNQRMLYPELYVPGKHAVIDRLMSREVIA